jgi:L-threonylcarbamoyladenylate synthase
MIERRMKTNVLFVCSGNTCRSPMAWALARQFLTQAYQTELAGLDRLGIAVASGGTFAMPGLRATPQAVEAVAELGADLQPHRSTPVTPELIHAADFVFAMGRSHVQALRSMAPSAGSRIQLLDPTGDIEDPIGSDVRVYRALAQKMEKLIADRLSETVLKAIPPTGGTT